MILKDLHVHTTFSDGVNTPEEIAEKAFLMGVSTLGFSDHSYTWFDESYCMKKDALDEYLSRIRKLKCKYEGNMNVLCGIELDALTDLSEFKRSDFDYIIGSCHYLNADGNYFALDESKDDFILNCDKYFGGDIIKMAEAYFKTLADFVCDFKPDIVGHFDYITRFNERSCLFDENDPLYVKAWRKALKRILPSCAVFELNFGGMSRGIKSAPYPSSDIVQYLKTENAEIIPSSDAHNKNHLCFNFQNFKDYA